MLQRPVFRPLSLLLTVLLVSACQPSDGERDKQPSTAPKTSEIPLKAVRSGLAEPLVSHMYTADPSAHVFDGKLYIYPSHDVETDIAPNNVGDHFAMRDYHVFSLPGVGEAVTDHGVALSLEEVPWASRQLWAPDAAYRDGRYYLYFPAKDEQGIFRIGVAASTTPYGPFEAQPQPITGTYSIDPAVYADDDGVQYLYFGGIDGGQLQQYRGNAFLGENQYPGDDQPALMPRVARLSADMLSLDEPVRTVEILDAEGQPLRAGDHDRRFFEAAWVHKFQDKYYFSYSTGDTHKIVYATGDTPYGPFTYQGVILMPVEGWTNHHSIVEFDHHWYLFYHDSSLSGGATHLRSIKMTELIHAEDGSIITIDPYLEKE